VTYMRVLQPGASTTVQDAGRLAWQHLGVSPAGFADPLLAELGNTLVGNPPDAAVLEWTLHGDTLQVVRGPVRVAVAAWADARVDGQPVPTFRALRLDDGQVLTVGPLARGRHGVLAVAGGVQTDAVLGSRSVHVRTGIGGRALQAGDLVPVIADAMQAPAHILALPLVPPPLSVLRILPGPQIHAFAPDALATLTSSLWQVRAADRMGARLTCDRVHVAPFADFEPVSEGVVTGALQFPPSGQAILLGPDRQTIGGYAKLAVVIAADLRHLAQVREGQVLGFSLVNPDQAIAAYAHAEADRAHRLAAMAVAHDWLPAESSCLLRHLT
jgi:biotin-dependent carboxylase-like uncharacterized protein